MRSSPSRIGTTSTLGAALRLGEKPTAEDWGFHSPLLLGAELFFLRQKQPLRPHDDFQVFALEGFF